MTPAENPVVRMIWAVMIVLGSLFVIAVIAIATSHQTERDAKGMQAPVVEKPRLVT